MKDEIRALEQRLLQPGVRKDREELLRLIAENFVEFGSSGRAYTREEIIAALLSEQVRPPASMHEVMVDMLAPEVALITYRSVGQDAAGNEAGQALRSSVWVRREGRWQVRFHQGTRVA